MKASITVSMADDDGIQVVFQQFDDGQVFAQKSFTCEWSPEGTKQVKLLASLLEQGRNKFDENETP